MGVLEELLLFAKFNGYGDLSCALPEAWSPTDIASFTQSCIMNVGIKGLGAHGGIYEGQYEGQTRSHGIFAEADTQREPWCRPACTLKLSSCFDGFIPRVPKSFCVGPSPGYLSRHGVLQ